MSRKESGLVKRDNVRSIAKGNKMKIFRWMIVGVLMMATVAIAQYSSFSQDSEIRQARFDADMARQDADRARREAEDAKEQVWQEQQRAAEQRREAEYELRQSENERWRAEQERSRSSY